MAATGAKARHAAASFLRATAPSLVFLVALEVILRLVWHLPSGYFNFLLPTFKGLYPANATIHNNWGHVPFVVKTNSLGLRGSDTSARKTRPRIVTIGDSMTEGFSVDNESTYPHQLGVYLDEQGIDWEVLNAARAGGSIDKELAILKNIGLQLEPDVVVLTFVTNDIAELEGKTTDAILNRELDFRKGSMASQHGVWLWLITRSAVAEALYRLYWNAMVRKGAEPPAGEPGHRFAVAGGDDFAQNVRIFNEAYGDYDGLTLQASLTPRAEYLVGQYFVGLEHFVRACREAGAQPVLVYFPAYPQVYDVTTPMTMRDLLRDRCKDLDVPFCDLTPTFREQGHGRVLHFAPVDFHLNPDGYHLMGRAIGAFLVEHQLVH